MRFSGDPAQGWSSDFVYAKSLRVASPGPRSRTPKATQHSDEWLHRSTRSLGMRSFSGSLTPKDQEDLHRRLAIAGREFNKGYITEDVYHKYVDALLHGKENMLVTAPQTRPHSAPHSCHTPAPKQEDEFARPALAKTLPRRAPIYDESKYQQSVRARSARERSRALAWMEKVVRRDHSGNVNGGARSQACNEVSAANEVLVKGAPQGTPKAAIKELMLNFGTVTSIKAIEIDGKEMCFSASFPHLEHASLAVRAAKVTLNVAVIISPLPRGGDLATLRRICSRWGKVSSVRPHISSQSAVVTFETEAGAKKAVGKHTIEASAELHVTGIPADAKEEHIRGAFGGLRGGVTGVLFEPVLNESFQSAIVTFSSSHLAARAAGTREVAITGRGGAVSALAKAQAGAYKGHTAPWHSMLKERPFANYEMHSYQFGHQPCSTREFKQRAAGTYGIEHRSKDLAGSCVRYTTRRVRVRAVVCTTTLQVTACPSIVTIISP